MAYETKTTRQVTVRLPKTLIARLDAAQVAATERAGAHVDWTAVVVGILDRGLAAEEGPCVDRG